MQPQEQWQSGPLPPQGYQPPMQQPMPPMQPQQQWQSGPLPPAPQGYMPPMQPQQGYYQPMVVQPQQNNNTLAIVLEVVGGLFGIFGIGWLISGETKTGLMFLIGGLIWIAVAVVLTIVTLGIGLVCIFPIDIGILITSTLLLNNKLKQRSMGLIR
jgi:hypothetical protein